MKMDFKRIVILSAVVAAVAACGRSSKAPDTTGAEASFAPSMTIALSDSLLHAGQTTDTIDMGRIRAGEIVRRDLLIRNAGSKPFVILSVRTSCGCTTVDFAKEPVMPGKEVPFSFEFDSKGFNGYQLKHITISTSAVAQPFTLVAAGEVIPAR